MATHAHWVQKSLSHFAVQMAPEDCLSLPRQESGFLGMKFIAGNGHIKTASTRELKVPNVLLGGIIREGDS